MTIARRLSDLDERKWQQQRRQNKSEAKQRIKDGEFLAKQRDRGKRTFEDMSATEQQLIEDYETQKSSREYEALRVKKPRINRGS